MRSVTAMTMVTPLNRVYLLYKWLHQDGVDHGICQAFQRWTQLERWITIAFLLL